MNGLQIQSSWGPLLQPEIDKDYMVKLKGFLQDRVRVKSPIFPKPDEWFSALELTPIEKVKVVILGQDPYHGPGQAHGLCFSVNPGVPLPPSLKNIYKEMASDIGVSPTNNGYLKYWAEQGVLLLNSVLTVEQGRAGAHAKKGWETFTDQIIHLVNAHRENVAFVLWGAYAQKKGAFVDNQRHLVIKSPHPSPLSAHRGFFGSKPFSKINSYLENTGQTPVHWQLPN